MDHRIHQLIDIIKAAYAKRGFNLSKVVLFGSHAKGNACQDSDIDLILISDDFAELSLLKRLELFGEIAAVERIFAPVEALSYSQEEYKSMGPGSFIGDEVKRVGVVVQ